jgi:hypothetical protein
MLHEEYKMQRQGLPVFNRRFLAYSLFAHRAKRLQFPQARKDIVRDLC